MPVGGPADAPRPVRAAQVLRGAVRLPGSKSLTNRAMMLAALSAGRTVLRGALRSADTDALAAALRTLGVSVSIEGDRITVEGCNGRLPAGADVRIDLGDGGTPTRFALALAACAPRRVTVDGSPRMRERPVADGVRLLRALGVSVEATGSEDRLPVTVDGRAGPPRGGTLAVGEVASSQFVSAMLLTAPWMHDGLDVVFGATVTSRSYVDLTVDELRRWGAMVTERIDETGALRAIHVAGVPPTARDTLDIEPDASSAVPWAVAAALVPGADLTFPGLAASSRQPDMRAVEALRRMGAMVDGTEQGCRVRSAVPAGDRSAPLRGIEADLSDAPDGALALMAAAAAATGISRFTGLATLRVKESDRLAAMAEGLARVGARASITHDTITIEPIPATHAVQAIIDPHDDHRVAMAFAALGLRTGGVTIEHPGCVAKSYPGFWTDLAMLSAPTAHAARPSGIE